MPSFFAPLITLSDLGTRIVRTPFFMSAEALSSSTSTSKEKLRQKEPKEGATPARRAEITNMPEGVQHGAPELCFLRHMCKRDGAMP